MLVEQAVQRDRDRERLVARLRPNPGYDTPAPPEPDTRVEWPSFRPLPRIDDNWYTTPRSQFDTTRWITTTASTTNYFTPDIWYSTGSTLVYNQPWTWLGNGTGATTIQTSYTVPRYQQPPPLTPEQREANRLHRERIRADGARMRAEAEAASVVAYELLDGLLSEEQRAEFQRERRITVDAPSGNRYQLVAGQHAGNVCMWHPEQRRWSGRLCVHIDIEYPDGDNLAAQLLMIATDESRFLGTANVQDGLVPPAMNALRQMFRIGVNLQPERQRALVDVAVAVEEAMPAIRETYEEIQSLQRLVRTGVAAA